MLADPVIGVLSLLLPVATITVVRFIRGRQKLRELSSVEEGTLPSVESSDPHDPVTGLAGFAKRAIDVVAAGAFLLLASPLLLFIAIGVKLSSPGPILFKQRRYGLNNKEIVVYRFRSMALGDDNGPVVAQATRTDHRVTRFGLFLRRTSLDELPQFINVLQGRMSIVGPRPHAVASSEHYHQLINDYALRHKVKPGITGWAQAHGYWDESASVERLKRSVSFDVEYARRWSLLLDLQILGLTLSGRLSRAAKDG